MARLAGVSPVGILQHIIQRGNNRSICFGSEDDVRAYASWLKDYSVKYSVNIHALFFMTNHVHLLCTPQRERSISQMKQSLFNGHVEEENTKAITEAIRTSTNQGMAIGKEHLNDNSRR
ncbi:MAG: transposase [Kangiellaceae bacterium]|jgi:putative transposase|nr:transposase [Kangiellaceae bacterium]